MNRDSHLFSKLGIFRLSGTYSNDSGLQGISYHSADFMGTDGWCELDLKSDYKLSVLQDIQVEVLQHLTWQTYALYKGI